MGDGQDDGEGSIGNEDLGTPQLGDVPESLASASVGEPLRLLTGERHHFISQPVAPSIDSLAGLAGHFKDS